jgi:hypothetical protein
MVEIVIVDFRVRAHDVISFHLDVRVHAGTDCLPRSLPEALLATLKLTSNVVYKSTIVCNDVVEASSRCLQHVGNYLDEKTPVSRTS